MEQSTPHNLGTFRILFLVKGILTILTSIFPLLYAVVGSVIGSMDEFHHAFNEMPFNPGIIVTFIGGFAFLFLMTIGILTVVAAKFLDEIRNYNFIFVVAILNCLTGILGILLGVFTLIELNKFHVRELFFKNQPR